jgi:hypothetical protein
MYLPSCLGVASRSTSGHVVMPRSLEHIALETSSNPPTHELCGYSSTEEEVVSWSSSSRCLPKPPAGLSLWATSPMVRLPYLLSINPNTNPLALWPRDPWTHTVDPISAQDCLRSRSVSCSAAPGRFSTFALYMTGTQAGQRALGLQSTLTQVSHSQRAAPRAPHAHRPATLLHSSVGHLA